MPAPAWVQGLAAATIAQCSAGDPTELRKKPAQSKEYPPLTHWTIEHQVAGEQIGETLRGTTHFGECDSAINVELTLPNGEVRRFGLMLEDDGSIGLLSFQQGGSVGISVCKDGTEETWNKR